MGNIITFLLLAVILNAAYSQSLSNVKKLYNDLFSNYTKEVMPMADHSKPLSVGVTFFLSSLNYFKEVDEMVSILGVLCLNWTDPSLTWDPASHGYLYSTVIDPKDMWTPSLFLINRVDTMEPIGHKVTFQTTITYTGDIFFYPGSTLEAKCPSDISKFPFDTQECTIKILPWGIEIPKLILKSLTEEAQLDWYTVNSDWTLQEYTTSVVTKLNYNLFYFKMKIKRQALYYSVIIILPTIFFAFLNPLVFILPVESGERVSLAMTILLSYAIFLTLVSASIPASSNPMCVLLITMIIIIFISGIITLGAIVSAKYYYEEDVTTIFGPLQWFAKWKLKRKKSNGGLSRDKEKEIILSGKDVSSAIDSVFFYGSYIGLILSGLAYFIYVLV